MPLPLFFENTNETYTLIGSSAIRYYFERTNHQTREIEKPKDQYIYIYIFTVHIDGFSENRVSHLFCFPSHTFDTEEALGCRKASDFRYRKCLNM